MGGFSAGFLELAHGMPRNAGATRQPKPGLKPAHPRVQTKDAGAAPEPVTAIRSIAGSTPVAKPDAVEIAVKVVDVVMSDKGPQDISHLIERRKQARVEPRTADRLVPGSLTTPTLPHCIVLGQWYVKESQSGWRSASRLASDALRRLPVPDNLVLSDPGIASDAPPQHTRSSRVSRACTGDAAPLRRALSAHSSPHR